MNDTYRFVKGVKLLLPPDLVPQHFGGRLREDLPHPHDAWIATAIVMPLHLLFEAFQSERNFQDRNGKVACRKLRCAAMNDCNAIGADNEMGHGGKSERRNLSASCDSQLIQKN